MRVARFTVPGTITGKGRPRVTLRAGVARTYTPAATVAAETRVRDAWNAAGRPWLGEGPVSLSIVLWEARPASHWTSKGELSASGRRSPRPMRKPDLDNVAKLIADALNGCLYRDDKQIVELRICRKWLYAQGNQSEAVVRVEQMEEAA